MLEASNTANTNFRWSYALMDGLIAGGLEHVIISPGSRSTPLALAAVRHPKIKIRVILDERVASFFALGIARAEGKPVALIATSGTAVTEWLPAVTEADLSRIPLILLSADRPPELRQCGANQTIQQNDLFGSRTRFSMELPLPSEDLLQAASHYGTRAAAAANWPLTGPVHLNVPFREPLTPSNDVEIAKVRSVRWSRPVLQPQDTHIQQIADSISGRRGLIVCGPELGDALPAREIGELAKKLGAPVLADPLSNLRCSLNDQTTLISQYDACLRSSAFVQQAKPDWVIRLGAMPVSKVLGQFLTDLSGTQQILIESSGRWTDPVHSVDELLQADPKSAIAALSSKVESTDSDWLSLWQTRQDEVSGFLTEAPPVEAQVVETLASCLPAGSRLFSGNSLAVRQLDWFLCGREEPLRIFCNRGASGIDGNVATLLGIASVSNKAVVGVLGDLSLQHDISALAEAHGMDAVILVLDNGGGGIFDYLPQSSLDEHESLFITPRSLDLEALSKGFGVGYQKTSLTQLADDLNDLLKTSGVHVLHLSIDRQLSLSQHKAFFEKTAPS